jgi:hypothetical protein
MTELEKALIQSLTDLGASLRRRNEAIWRLRAEWDRKYK